MKIQALNPADLGIQARIDDAIKHIKEIEDSLLAARDAKDKMEEEQQNAYAKAQMASIEAAKAKAAAERAFRAMVMHNNKTCSLCNLGKEKIAKRRLEISQAIQNEIKKKAERMAERKRQKDKHQRIRTMTITAGDIYSNGTPRVPGGAVAQATAPA